ncbi:MAG: N-acetylmuramoyl-L-alanine amidase [Polyangia bacterium]
MENRVTRYRPRKELLGQPGDLSILQQLIRQIVIHHDGADSSAECFHVLHDERGLSVHFLIDTDGTVYQTLDLADVAFHAQFVNGMSIGIELCNRGLVELSCSPAHRRQREPCITTIHGRTYKMWSFTDAQYDSLARLTAALGRIFPRLPLGYPQSGGPIFGKLAEPARYSGLLGHYHVSTQKWDPGCFDFKRLLARLPARRMFAAAAVDGPGGSAADPDEGRALLHAEAANPHGGSFPVSRCGAELVWHGGVHLALPVDAPVAAILGGQLVAARLQRPGQAFGSTNFVLTRHELAQGARRQVFFILYYHLAAALGASDLPAWARHKRAERAAPARLSGLDVFFPDVDILAGEVLGQVGLAGPPGEHLPQLHLEVFAAEDVASALLPGHFRSRDCGAAGLRCLDEEIQALVMAKGSSPRALAQEPATGALRRQAETLRRLALRFPSEWWLRSREEFERELRQVAAYRRTPAARAAVYCEQVQPAAWLDARVARRLGLPEEHLVWHYHPIEFLSALLASEGRLVPSESAPVQAEAEAEPQGAGPAAEDGSKSDTGYASEEDLAEWEVGNGAELTTEELASGYPTHWLR